MHINRRSQSLGPAVQLDALMPIRNIDDFVLKTNELDARLRRFSVRTDGQRKVAARLFQDLVDRRGGNLFSANAAARIAFAQEAAEALPKRVRPARSRQAFQVTLCPSLGFVRASELEEQAMRVQGFSSQRSPENAISVARRRIADFATDHFRGTSYFGVIELAFYTTHPTSIADGPIFHVHAHVIAWDAAKTDIDAIAAEINARHCSMLPDRPAAHAAPINTVNRLTAVGLYSLKPPFDEYRAYRDGEDPVTAVWNQRTRPLRPAHAAKVASTLVGVEVPDLCFEGGGGSGLTEKIASRARRRLRRQEAIVNRELLRRI